VSKSELPNFDFKRLEKAVRDKIACKTHLEFENYSSKHFFGILIKFPIE